MVHIRQVMMLLLHNLMSLKTLTGKTISRIASIIPGTGGSGFRVGDKIRLLNER